MISIIRNNINRLIKEKAFLIVSLIMLIVAVVSAVLISGMSEIRGNVAVLGVENVEQFKENKYLNFHFVDEYPNKSSMVRGIYDAIISIDGQDINIETLKDEDFKNNVKLLVTHPELIPEEDTAVKKVGSNIIGYMLMFILFQSLQFGNLMSEEKEKHIIDRISTSPIGFFKYTFGHMIFNFTLIYVQTIVLVGAINLLGFDVGFTLIQYAWILAILCLLAVSISIFLNSIFKISDSYLMIGSSFIILSTILAGGFSNFVKKETLLHKLLYIIPQKDFIKFVDAVERQNITSENMLQLAYVLVFTLVCICFGIMKLKKDHEYRAS